MVPVFRFFEYVNFERKEQKVNSTSKQNLCMARLQNMFSSKNDNYFVTNCYHGNDTWLLFRPTFELRKLISWKLTWWPPIFFTLVSLSFENETTWSFKKISVMDIQPHVSLHSRGSMCLIRDSSWQVFCLRFRTFRLTASVCRLNMTNQTKRCEEILKSETNGNIAN